MRLVEIESPFAGDVAHNVNYARAALLDSLKRGEAPFASHLLYTQVLDDTVPELRKQGMEAGKAWTDRADLIAVYTDLGISDGMKWGIEQAEKRGIEVVHRTIEGWKEETCRT